MTYPSGRVVSYTLNNADQPTAVQGTLHGTPSVYGSSIAYSPGGDIASLTFGNNVTETRNFNDQFETMQVQAGSLLTIQNYYCDGGMAQCASGNTGSPWRQVITAGGQSAVQEYRHDAARRCLRQRTSTT